MDPLENATPGSVGLAATYLAISIVFLFGAIAASAWDILFADLISVWLSSVLFTLGMMEYRRSQAPPGTYVGPNV